MNKRALKRLIVIPIIAAIGYLIFFVPMVTDAFYFYFAEMLMLSIACFEQEIVSYGIIVLLLQIVAWAVAGIMFYFGVFNMVFPRIRFVNEMRTKNTFARKVIQFDGADEDHIYLKVKFRLFPFFDWYTLKLPNPKFYRDIEFKRMPSSIDIHSHYINAVWSPVEHLYMMTKFPLSRLHDDVDFYRNSNQKIIKHVGEYVGDAIHGDSNMMKDYYTMSLVMDENNEPIPKQMLKKPPTEKEKEVEEADE